nr:sigma-70 family RNA polymerase sigma factor [Sphingomonas colocasiae]
MPSDRRAIVAWVGSNIVPHEGELRARLRRMAVAEHEIGDIVQDTYLKLARLNDVSHIRDGRAYFFTAARTVLLDRIRRDRIVRIDSLAEVDALALADEAPDPERRVSARLELERVRALIDALPDRCREIFHMRRVEALPQREIAARMGVSQEVVEAQTVRGLKLILKAIAAQGRNEGQQASLRKREDGKQRN